MKLLVRGRNNDLTWVDATYKSGNFCSLDGSVAYNINTIYAVKDDSRNKIVVCSACGQEITNTPSAIKTHRNMVDKPNKCFECSYLRHKNTKTISHKYTLNEDGTYTENTKNNVTLTCGRKYVGYDINSNEAKQNCRYAACQNATFKRITDFWTQYPNAFDELITVDRIIDVGYKNMYRNSSYTSFDLKGKANLEAHTNSQGICYEFKLYYRRKSYILRYSKKYDKVWVEYYSNFKDLSEFYSISDNTREAVLKKFRDLYN